MPGGHAVVAIDQLRVPQHHMLGASGEGLRYAQVRTSPARLSHCLRWFGTATRAQQIPTAYARRREALVKPPIDPAGVGVMLAVHLIVSRQTELMIDW